MSGEFPKRKLRNNNHPELYPSQFDLLRDDSPSWAPTWSHGTFSPYVLVFLRTRLFTHSSPYALVSLCTCLPTHLFSYALVLLLHLYTSRKNIPLKYLSEIVHLSRRYFQLSWYAMRNWSYWLDAIDASLLCGSQPCHQLARVTSWMTSGHFQYIISSIMKAHLQYAIEYSGKLARWQRSNGYPPLIYHQVSQQ